MYSIISRFVVSKFSFDSWQNTWSIIIYKQNNEKGDIYNNAVATIYKVIW